MLSVRCRHIIVFSLLAAVLFGLSCGNPVIREIWDLKEITFDSCGGSYVSTQQLLKGSPVKRPSNPVRHNYIFIDWFLEDPATNPGADNFIFGTVPDRDMTLYAGWEPVGIELTPPGNFVFPSLPEGYALADRTPYTVTFKNASQTAFSVNVSSSSPSFDVAPLAFGGVAPGTSDTFSVTPAVGLPMGVYSSVITVSGGGYSVTFTVSVTVTQGPVTALTIQTPPQLTYTHGDALNLSALVVRLTYGTSYTVDVPFAQFAANNLTVSLANGTTLSRSTHDVTAITVSYDGGAFTANTAPLVINPIVVSDITFPTASNVKVGQTLGASTLSFTSNTYGNFAWAVPAVTLSTAGTFNHNVLFTPTVNTTDYSFAAVPGWTGTNVNRTVPVTVLPLEGDVVLSLAIDPITDEALLFGTDWPYISAGRYYDSDIVLSIGDDHEFNLGMLPTGVTNPRWEVQGVGTYAADKVTGTGNTFTIKADLTYPAPAGEPNHYIYCVPGYHFVRLIVDANGRDYDVNIRFEIE